MTSQTFSYLNFKRLNQYFPPQSSEPLSVLFCYFAYSFRATYENSCYNLFLVFFSHWTENKKYETVNKSRIEGSVQIARKTQDKRDRQLVIRKENVWGVISSSFEKTIQIKLELFLLTLRNLLSHSYARIPTRFSLIISHPRIFY